MFYIFSLGENILTCLLWTQLSSKMHLLCWIFAVLCNVMQCRLHLFTTLHGVTSLHVHHYESLGFTSAVLIEELPLACAAGCCTLMVLHRTFPCFILLFIISLHSCLHGVESFLRSI
jgi:hypothetical protein